MKIKIPDFMFRSAKCMTKNTYSGDTKYSAYGIFCQKVNRHPLKINAIDNKITVIPVQTDNIPPNEHFLCGISTGVQGVHKIGTNDTIQVLGPTLVYNIKNNENLEIIQPIIKEAEVNTPILINTQKNLTHFNFDTHLQNNKKLEIHIFEFNTFMEKYANSIKLSQNPVYQHTYLLYNRQYENHVHIKSASLLSETTQEFFGNPGDKYKTKDLKKMGEEQEKILEMTLKTHTFKNEPDYQKYYELKKTATKIKNLVDKDSDFD